MKFRYLTTAVLIALFSGAPVMAQDNFYDSYFTSLETLHKAAIDLQYQAIAADDAGDRARACDLLRMAGSKFYVGRLDAEDNIDDMNFNGTPAEISAMRKILQIMKDGEALVTKHAASWSCPKP